MDKGAAKRRTSHRKAAAASEDEGEDAMTHASLGLDAFECPICLSLFEGPIFQCKNGHAVCDACRARIHGTCPTCRASIGSIRCWALENAIARMLVPCAFAGHGCARRLKHAERRGHEAVCQHAPCACPFQGCAYSAPLLHDHVRDAHAGAAVDVDSFFGSALVMLDRSTPFRVLLLHAAERSVLLLLNGGGVPSGRSLSVVCLAAGNPSLEYKLEVGGGGGGERGALSLSASGSVPCVRSWAGHRTHGTDGFLFVPDAYWSSSGCVPVAVHVHRSTVDNEFYYLWVLVIVFSALLAVLLGWSGSRAALGY